MGDGRRQPDDGTGSGLATNGATFSLGGHGAKELAGGDYAAGAEKGGAHSWIIAEGKKFHGVIGKIGKKAPVTLWMMLGSKLRGPLLVSDNPRMAANRTPAGFQEPFGDGLAGKEDVDVQKAGGGNLQRAKSPSETAGVNPFFGGLVEGSDIGGSDLMGTPGQNSVSKALAGIVGIGGECSIDQCGEPWFPITTIAIPAKTVVAGEDADCVVAVGAMVGDGVLATAGFAASAHGKIRSLAAGYELICG